jgi:hypothetical protein
MIMADVHEAKTHLPLRKPVRRNVLKPHPILSKIVINYDPTQPLTSEERFPACRIKTLL